MKKNNRIGNEVSVNNLVSIANSLTEDHANNIMLLSRDIGWAFGRACSHLGLTFDSAQIESKSGPDYDFFTEACEMIGALI